MIRRIVYISSATREYDEFELRSLAASVATRNKMIGLTGLLLYSGCHFMQVLEGPPSSIDVVMSRIQTDYRHHHITILIDDNVKERAFSRWHMGSMNPDHGKTIDRDRFLQLVDSFQKSGARQDLSRTATMAILRDFHTLVAADSPDAQIEQSDAA